MAKLVEPVRRYVVELSQDEVELILLLTGSITGSMSNSDVNEIASGIWTSLDTAVRGERSDYIIDGVTYDATVTIVKAAI
jgi:hypothetical protein